MSGFNLSQGLVELLKDVLAAALLAVANVLVDALFGAVTRSRGLSRRHRENSEHGTDEPDQ